MNNTIKEKIINYAIAECKNQYAFIKSTKDLGVSCYPSNEIDKHVNSFWELYDSEKAIREIIESLSQEPMNINFKFAKVKNSFYENIWIKCSKNREEEAVFFKLFSNLLNKYGYQPFSEIETFKSNEYLNLFIMKYFISDGNYQRTNEDTINPLIDFFNKSTNFKLHEDNLKLMCSQNSYPLKKIKTQQKLKKFVEEFMPNLVEKTKKYWHKVDDELEKNKEFVTSGECIYIGFNKKQVFNFFDDKDIEFYNRKFKSMNTFFNKKDIQKTLKIERAIFDGMQESQSEYKFIILGAKDPVLLKEYIGMFVSQLMPFEKELDMPTMKKTLNYVILDNKMPEKVNNVLIKKNKI